MPPLVSVVIPCYRQAHFLAQAVESVLRQSHPAHEIIVVDDGSPDAVAEVLQTFPGVRLIVQDNRGLGAARNRGLAEARGEFVVFLDADDRLLPNALSAGVTALTSDPAYAFVWGYNRPINARGDPVPYQSRRFAGRASYAELLRSNVVGPPLGVMFRRSCVMAVNGFSTEVRFAEDYDLYLRLAREYNFYCHGQTIGEYRTHADNMSANCAGMLQGMFDSLNRQAPWVQGQAHLRRALAAGRRNARQQFDGLPRLELLGKQLRARRWIQVAASAAVLVLKYPELFLPAVARRARRSLGLSRASG
jgi:glycosyltransferase involved in cell wall biosynthesis